MKALPVRFKNTLLYCIVLVVTASCSTPGHRHEIEKTESHHEHGENSAEGGHMSRMNDIREKLKKELADKYDQPILVATKKQLVLGKSIYTKSCASCHGTSGDGNGIAATTLTQKPADFTDPEHSKFYSDQGRIQIIKKGIQNTAMPAWENILSEKEIQSVYAYVWSLRDSRSEAKHIHSHGDHNH